MDAFTEENIPEKVGAWRLAYFRKQLYETTYKHFLKTREEIKNMSPGLCEELGLSSDEEDDNLAMTEWPDYFVVDEVPKAVCVVLGMFGVGFNFPYACYGFIGFELGSNL